MFASSASRQGATVPREAEQAVMQETPRGRGQADESQKGENRPGQDEGWARMIDGGAGEEERGQERRTEENLSGASQFGAMWTR
ncbi:uncharacterized protein SPSK_01332 [Sporothrix schenckii 1099-18]|uniref:Uncharacterized protein n=1 Tax=Sporothrix schenckii 1099-18 TaxID=1397361 RepID=A0A0F2LV54_SPOSC|nr:uncharacterized protein SPSK_01332 [Sporothrix schenckii 1099-18]KJR81343.1 hypothetical protein SPSK_01332 [Sporothrix schenckii 1099-18]